MKQDEPPARADEVIEPRHGGVVLFVIHRLHDTSCATILVMPY
jgi:hypothetical protein